MKEAYWLTQAKLLPAGQRRKIQCCAADRSMIVSNGPKGYSGYCFRCGTSEFEAHGLFSIAQLQRRRAEQELLTAREVKLPNDFTTDIPPSEAVWLYKAGVGTTIARHYGFGYSPSLSRVILPVYKDGKLQGYTARSTINERPKYIEKMAAPSSTVWVSDATVALPSAREADLFSRVVLTEDILSAVRVGRIVRHAVSLMGTSCSAEQLHAIRGLQAQSVRYTIWLDPDRAGKHASTRLRRSLALQGYDVTVVKSERDPKFYSNNEIRRLLQESD